MSFRTRLPGRDASFKRVLQDIDHAFEQRYGADWQRHLRMAPGPDDPVQGVSETVFVMVDGHTVPFAVRVQPERSIANAMTVSVDPAHAPPPPRDDGKTHWGVVEVEGFPFIPHQ